MRGPVVLSPASRASRAQQRGQTVAQAALLAAPGEKGSSPRGARPGQRAGTGEQESARSKDECSFQLVMH